MSPGKHRGRPGDKAATAEEKTPAEGLPAAIVDDPADTVAAQLRRRREASLRLPLLPSGYRDPIDELAARR